MVLVLLRFWKRDWFRQLLSLKGNDDHNVIEHFEPVTSPMTTTCVSPIDRDKVHDRKRAHHAYNMNVERNIPDGIICADIHEATINPSAFSINDPSALFGDLEPPPYSYLDPRQSPNETTPCDGEVLEHSQKHHRISNPSAPSNHNPARGVYHRGGTLSRDSDQTAIGPPAKYWKNQQVGSRYSGCTNSTLGSFQIGGFHGSVRPLCLRCNPLAMREDPVSDYKSHNNYSDQTIMGDFDTIFSILRHRIASVSCCRGLFPHYRVSEAYYRDNPEEVELWSCQDVEAFPLWTWLVDPSRKWEDLPCELDRLESMSANNFAFYRQYMTLNTNRLHATRNARERFYSAKFIIIGKFWPRYLSELPRRKPRTMRSHMQKMCVEGSSDVLESHGIKTDIYPWGQPIVSQASGTESAIRSLTGNPAEEKDIQSRLPFYDDALEAVAFHKRSEQLIKYLRRLIHEENTARNQRRVEIRDPHEPI